MIVDDSALLGHKNSSRDLGWKLDVVGGFQFQGKRKDKANLWVSVFHIPLFTVTYCTDRITNITSIRTSNTLTLASLRSRLLFDLPFSQIHHCVVLISTIQPGTHSAPALHQSPALPGTFYLGCTLAYIPLITHLLCPLPAKLGQHRPLVRRSCALSISLVTLGLVSRRCIRRGFVTPNDTPSFYHLWSWIQGEKKKSVTFSSLARTTGLVSQMGLPRR